MLSGFSDVLPDKYLKPLSLKNPGALKLDDDIYFDSKKKIAVSVDTYVEGVHEAEHHVVVVAE